MRILFIFNLPQKKVKKLTLNVPNGSEESHDGDGVAEVAGGTRPVHYTDLNNNK